MGCISYAIHGTILTLLIVANTFPATVLAAAVSDQNIDQGVLQPEETNDFLPNGSCTVDTVETNVVSPRPFYVIGHRVLEKQAVYDAINNGANALEIDMTAQLAGWWADHDGNLFSRGDTAQTMFETIAALRDAGKPISFVWLDIKNPDAYSPFVPGHKKGSINALRNLARQILQPRGIRVLYGFSNSKSYAYRSLQGKLNSYEAINLNGETQEVLQGFQTQGPEQVEKRVMSYGYFHLPFEFGDCYEKDYYTCTELRQAVQARQFAKVFAWTSAVGQGQYVDKLLGLAGVDGLIYGFKTAMYKDVEDNRAAAQDIIQWVENHPHLRYIATNDDTPW
ncbi:MAG: hypothetical protein Q9195_002677 [Heterodermia aff. obscurata]